MRFSALLTLLLFFSCAHTQKTKEVLHPSMTKISAERVNYWSLKGARDVLKNTSQATLAVWINPLEPIEYPQDVISIAVGGSSPVHNSSRAALRLEKGGRLYGIARARDEEAAQSVQTAPVILPGRWQHVVLTIDYAQNQMQFYLDGKLVPVVGKVKFKAKKTSDTSSYFVVVGSEDDGLSRFYLGDLKHVGIWNRILSQREIQELVEGFVNQYKIN